MYCNTTNCVKTMVGDVVTNSRNNLDFASEVGRAQK